MEAESVGGGESQQTQSLPARGPWHPAPGAARDNSLAFVSPPVCGVPAARAKTGASARALPRGSRATETALCSQTRPAARRFGSAQRFLNQTLSVHEAPVLSFPVVNDAPCWRNSITYLLILLLIDECHSLFFFLLLQVLVFVFVHAVLNICSSSAGMGVFTWRVATHRRVMTHIKRGDLNRRAQTSKYQRL